MAQGRLLGECGNLFKDPRGNGLIYLAEFAGEKMIDSFNHNQAIFAW
jgi:hypothetical protein